MSAYIEVGDNGQHEDRVFWRKMSRIREDRANRESLSLRISSAYDTAARMVEDTDPKEGRGQIWRLRLHTLQSLRGSTDLCTAIGTLLFTELGSKIIRIAGFGSFVEHERYLMSWRVWE